MYAHSRGEGEGSPVPYRPTGFQNTHCKLLDLTLPRPIFFPLLFIASAHAPCAQEKGTPASEAEA